MNKIGLRQDSHRFAGNKPLILGGVKITHSQGFSANSDGDVVLHALCNALVSAVGKGSISTYADKMSKEEGIVDSKEYVKVAWGFAREAGYQVSNVSIAIEAKEPKLEKYFSKMKEVIAELLEIDTEQVGITATTGEELTPFGKGEGVQVFAIVLLFG